MTLDRVHMTFIIHPLESAFLKSQACRAVHLLGSLGSKLRVLMMTRFEVGRLIPDVNRKLSDLSREKGWRRALERLYYLRSVEISADLASFTIVAASMHMKWQRSCSLLQESQRQRLQANTISCGASLGACEKSSQWKATVSLLAEMKLNALQSSLIAENSATSAFGEVTRWPQALRMVGCMKGRLIEPDHISCSATMVSLDVAGCWNKALRSLHLFREEQIQLDVVAWTSLCTVCATGKQWKRCLETLSCMSLLKCTPNAVSYRTAYLACESAEELHSGQELLLQSGVDPAFALWALAKMSSQDPHKIYRACVRALRFVAKPGAVPAAQVAAVCWAARALGAVGKNLERKLGSLVKRNLHDFTIEQLMILAWGFCDLQHSAEVLGRVQQEACRRLALQNSDLSMLGTVKVEEVLGLVGGCALAGGLQASLSRKASSFVRDHGRLLDAHSGVRCVLPLSEVRMWSAAPTAVQPCCHLDVGDRLVVHKPVGWEVHDMHGDFQLHHWIQRHHLHVPILSDSQRDFGFLHRLDVPSSGLLVVAKTFEAFHDLQLQLASGVLERYYLVLCHGWVPNTVKELTSQLSLEGRVSVPGRGKPCRTWLRSRRHFRLSKSGCAQETSSVSSVSLVNVTIATGRMHQIRCHLAHAGHPTVSDGKYTSEGTFAADLSWCPRNFLHRNRVNFKDWAGRPCAVTAPCAKDLEEVVGRMALARPVGVN